MTRRTVFVEPGPPRKREVGSFFSLVNGLGSGPATVASARAVANEMMNEYQSRESHSFSLATQESAARWLSGAESRRPGLEHIVLAHDPHLAAQRSTPTTATSSRAPSRRTSNSHQGDRRGALLRPSSDLADKLARSATSGTASCASYAARRESSLGWDTSRSSMGHIRCVGRVRAGARAPAQEKRRHARAVCPAGEAWSKGRLRQGAACAAPCVHIRAVSALGYDASVRV